MLSDVFPDSALLTATIPSSSLGCISIAS